MAGRIRNGYWSFLKHLDLSIVCSTLHMLLRVFWSNPTYDEWAVPCPHTNLAHDQLTPCQVLTICLGLEWKERPGIKSKKNSFCFRMVTFWHCDSGTYRPLANSGHGKISTLGKQPMEIRGVSQVLMDKVKNEFETYGLHALKMSLSSKVDKNNCWLKTFGDFLSSNVWKPSFWFGIRWFLNH